MKNYSESQIITWFSIVAAVLVIINENLFIDWLIISLQFIAIIRQQYVIRKAHKTLLENHRQRLKQLQEDQEWWRQKLEEEERRFKNKQKKD